MKKRYGFGQSVYHNLVKKNGFWTKCVLELGKKKMGLKEVCIRMWWKKNGFWTKCVLEFDNKKMGFGRSVY